MPSILVRDLTLSQKARLAFLKRELEAKSWSDVVPDAMEALARERLMPRTRFK